MSTVISVSTDGQFGTTYKIIPETTQNFTNRVTCFKIPGMQGAAVMPQGVLPNISNYKVSVLYGYCIIMLVAKFDVDTIILYVTGYQKRDHTLHFQRLHLTPMFNLDRA